MWRHGDVLIAATATAVPEGARRRQSPVLARGEVTGHSHRVAEPETAEVWEWDGILYLNVTARSATIVHEEHKPITLQRGLYRVWMQREYTPERIRQVID